LNNNEVIMKKIRYFVLLLILPITGIASAQQQISEQEAKNVAINTFHCVKEQTKK